MSRARLQLQLDDMEYKLGALGLSQSQEVVQRFSQKWPKSQHVKKYISGPRMSR